MSMMYKQIHEMPSPLDTAALGLPAVTRAVVTRALAKKPEERYPTAGEFAKYLSGLQGAPLPIAPNRPVEKPPSQPLTLPISVTPAKTTSTTAPAPRTAQRWSLWMLGLAGLPILGALICIATFIAINPLGSKAASTPTLTRTLRPTETNAPASPTPRPTPTPTPLPPTATLTPTDTVTPTFTATPTLLPSATTVFAPTVRPATRIPATNTAFALPTNTFVPPTDAPPTSVPPTEPPPTPPTNTPVPEPPTNTPVP